MKNYNYTSEICEYCVCTDFGCAPVGTGPWNICEGCGCVEAYEDWKEDHPNDCRELEDMF